MKDTDRRATYLGNKLLQPQQQSEPYSSLSCDHTYRILSASHEDVKCVTCTENISSYLRSQHLAQGYLIANSGNKREAELYNLQTENNLCQLKIIK